MNSAEPPKLAILDWNMPGVDGPTLCRELRQVPALSSHVRDPDHEQPGSEGCGRWASRAAPTTTSRSRSTGTNCARAFASAAASSGCSIALAARVAGPAGGAVGRQTPRRPAADLRLLQTHPRRRRLLEADRAVSQRSTQKRSSATASARSVSSNTCRACPASPTGAIRPLFRVRARAHPARGYNGAMPYPEPFIAPMRAELSRIGVRGTADRRRRRRRRARRGAR